MENSLRQWDNLSVQEKADIMKVAIQNGITNLSDIKVQYNSFAEGGFIPQVNENIYAGGSYLDIAKSNIRRHEGFLSKPYADGPKGTGWRSVGYGFNDSGFRAKYPGGISRHYENGITKAQAEKELDYILGNMVNDLKRTYGKKWDSFNDNQKAAIIDTYYQRPASVGKKSAFYSAVMAGKDPTPYLGVNGFKNRNRDRKALFSGNAKYTADYDVPSQSSRSEYTDNRRDIQMPEFTPLYPEVFNSPQSNQSQVLPFKGPTVIFKDRSPIEQSAEEYAKYQELAEAKAQEESRQNIMSYLMSSLTPQQQSGDGYLSSIMAMLGSKNTPYGLFAEGGNLYGGGGGLKIGSKAGDRVNVSQCAAWSNKVLQNNGYSIHGDAWSPSNAIPVFSGYNQAARPKSYNRAAVVEYNHQAANNVGRYFNPNKLDKNQPYTVNMYYNGSHYQDQAYRNGKGVAGTHTGILHFDDKKGWVVTHNSGGHIKEDKYSAIANGNGKYGITAIFQPTKGKYNGGGKDIQVLSRGNSAPAQQSQRSVDNSYQQRYNSDFEALPFNPIYPEIFNRDNAAPVLPFNNPIIIERDEPKVPTFDPYSPEVLAAQEKREKADNFMRIMSMLGSGSNDPNTSALNAISMLTGNKFAGGGDTNDNDNTWLKQGYTYIGNDNNGEPMYRRDEGITNIIEREHPDGSLTYHYNTNNGEVPLTKLDDGRYSYENADGSTSYFDVNKAKAYRQWQQEGGHAKDIDKVALGIMSLPLAGGLAAEAVATAPALAPGSAFWASPLTQGVLASELGARGWDSANVALTGNTWAQNLSKDIHRYTGWNPQESIGGQFLMEASNPGYFTPYSMVERGVNAATNGARKALDIWNSPLTGRWTTVGNKQYRLSPSSIGADGIPIESRMTSPQITEANAASLTPEQWTAAQDAATARGDMVEAQRLRDLHFKVSAPNTKFITQEGNPKHVYHGGQRGITKFLNAKDNPDYKKTRHQGYRHPETRSGIYTSDYLSVAKGYKYRGNKGDIYDLYINAENPFSQSYLRTSINQLKNANPFSSKRYLNPRVIRDKDLETTLKDYDAIIHGNGIENVVWNPNNIKSADAVTYDNNGVRIPLGERDNFSINDIRYGLLPFLGVGTAYGLSAEDE